MSCGFKVVSASCKGHPLTQWWTNWMRDIIKLQKSYQGMLAGRTQEEAEGYRRAKQAADLAVAEATA